MTEWIVPPQGMVELVPAVEIFADDVGAIELVGTDIRLHYYALQMSIDAPDTEAQKVCVVKIRRPLVTVPAMIGRLAYCLDPMRVPLAIPRGPFKPRLVD